MVDFMRVDMEVGGRYAGRWKLNTVDMETEMVTMDSGIRNGDHGCGKRDGDHGCGKKRW